MLDFLLQKFDEPVFTTECSRAICTVAGNMYLYCNVEKSIILDTNSKIVPDRICAAQNAVYNVLCACR